MAAIFRSIFSLAIKQTLVHFVQNHTSVNSVKYVKAVFENIEYTISEFITKTRILVSNAIWGYTPTSAIPPSELPYMTSARD